MHACVLVVWICSSPSSRLYRGHRNRRLHKRALRTKALLERCERAGRPAAEDEHRVRAHPSGAAASAQHGYQRSIGYDGDTRNKTSKGTKFLRAPEEAWGDWGGLGGRREEAWGDWGGMGGQPRGRLQRAAAALAATALVTCCVGAGRLAARHEGMLRSVRGQAAQAAVLVQLPPAPGGSELAGQPAAPDAMTLHMIPTELYPDALCNDGTPAGFYIRTSSDDSSGFALAETSWLVFLQGGFWCWDEESCTQRQGIYPQLMTSAKWAPTTTLSGIFSSQGGSPLASAHRIFVPYCSSDAWVGDMGGDAQGVLGMHFRGQAIVRAVFAELRRVYGLGRAAPGSQDRVFFGGASAGARGAMSLLDTIPALAPGAAVYGIFDSGLSLGLEPYATSALTPLTEQVKSVLTRHNAGGVLGNACREAHADAPWKCLLGEFRTRFLTRPYFLSESQYDSFQLFWDLGGKQPPYSVGAGAGGGGGVGVYYIICVHVN